jgi:hypothetical protein
VILVPVQEVLQQIQALSRPNSSYLLPHTLYNIPKNNANCQQSILTWAGKDRYKARLAVIHAGAVFWHIRRYSSDSLIQPFALFLATLALWAFGSASNKMMPGLQGVPSSEAESQSPNANARDKTWPENDAENCETPSTSDTSGGASTSTVPSQNYPHSRARRMPNQMQLDRPMDDELVQYFIQFGGEMRLYLEGVEDLCSDQGPSEILQEAVAILRERPTIWTISESYATYLDAIDCRGT